MVSGLPHSTPPGADSNDAELVLRAKRSVGDDIYEVLLSRLISLKIPPGARISIDQLARELGASQTPIRAALIRLEAEGLIVKTHLVGYSAAAMPSAQRFEEMFQVRLLLEPHAAAQAAVRLRDAERAELQSLAHAMLEPAGEDTRLAYGKFAHWDAQFHHLIARAGGGDVMAETLDRLHTQVHLFRLLFHSRVTEEAIKEHAELMEALARGDGAGARAAMEQHIQLSFKRIAPVLQALETAEPPVHRRTRNTAATAAQAPATHSGAQASAVFPFTPSAAQPPLAKGN